MTQSEILFDSDIRKKILKIPFGFLSGLSTCLTSILFLVFIGLVKYFQLFELSETFLKIGSIGALAIDGLLIFYELALKQVRSLFPKDQQKIVIAPPKNAAILFAFCFLEGAGEFLLMQKSLEYGVPLLNSILYLVSARALGSLFLGWLSDRIETRTGFIFSILVLLLALFLLEQPHLFGLAPGMKLVRHVLWMKGFFGCLFVLVKRVFVFLGTLQVEGETVHGF